MDHADNGRFRHISFRCPVAVAEALEAEAERTFSTVSAIARQADLQGHAGTWLAGRKRIRKFIRSQ